VNLKQDIGTTFKEPITGVSGSFWLAVELRKFLIFAPTEAQGTPLSDVGEDLRIITWITGFGYTLSRNKKGRTPDRDKSNYA
jgi:hypothetical protein